MKMGTMTTIDQVTSIAMKNPLTPPYRRRFILSYAHCLRRFLPITPQPFHLIFNEGKGYVQQSHEG